MLILLALVVTASLSSTNATASVRSWELLASGWYGILQSAGLLFFAFAGYARIATMGEEVRDPERVIPRAILTALRSLFRSICCGHLDPGRPRPSRGRRKFCRLPRR